MDLSLVVPTYNEAANLPALLDRIAIAFSRLGIEGEVLIVDDGSPDGTAELAGRLIEPYPVRVIQRGSKRGLSSAVLAGFEAARGRVLGVLDADLSHPPENIVELYRAVLDGAEVAVGSRLISGGETEGWNSRRHLTSWGATTLARPLVSVKDPMAGFFLLRREVLERAILQPKGYKLLLEILVRCRPSPVVEVPIRFVDRRAGASKLTLGLYGTYASHVLGLYPVRWPVLGQFSRFALVGAVGALVNLAVLVTLVELADVWYLVAGAIAFVVAVTCNFHWNRRWSFRQRTAATPGAAGTPQAYTRFLGVSIVGLLVNLMVLSIFVTHGMGYLAAQVMAIGAATTTNFTGSRYFAFRQ